MNLSVVSKNLLKYLSRNSSTKPFDPLKEIKLFFAIGCCVLAYIMTLSLDFIPQIAQNQDYINFFFIFIGGNILVELGYIYYKRHFA